MFRDIRLNNITVKPVVTQTEHNVKNVKGYKLIPQPIYTLFACARKKSGKTSVINTMVEKTTDKRTVFWIFCSTYRIDPTWQAIIKYLKNRGNQVNCFDSIMDGKDNLLQEIVDGLAEEDAIEIPEKSEIPKVTGAKINFGIDEKKKKEYKPKKVACQNLFILDDISQQLKNPAVTKLLKEHRHSKSSVIISSQYLHDLPPQSIMQLDYVLLFRSFSREKIELIHKLLDVSIPIEQFWDLYKHCVIEPYSFMYFSIRDELVRCGFNVKIDFDKIEE